MKNSTIIWLVLALPFSGAQNSIYAQKMQEHDPYAHDSERYAAGRPYEGFVHTLNGSVDTAWVRYFSGGWEDRNDWPTVMAVDGAGNVYVAGYTHGTRSSSDYLTVKYDSTGSVLWATRYRGPVGGEDEISDMVIDLSGNVYVTGFSYGRGTGRDYLTVKYNPDGVEQWVARYNGLQNYSDVARAIGVDTAGNVYVTGRSADGGRYIYATIKYNPDGVEQWVAKYNKTEFHNAGATALTVDAAGNVYVTGDHGSSRDDQGYVTIKYNTYGVKLWDVRYGGPDVGDEDPSAIALDPRGNVYVTGTSIVWYTGEREYATVKYNPNGVPQWVRRYNNPGDGWNEAYALAIDLSGNVYVTGSSGTIKYNTGGTQQWMADEPAFGIVVDTLSNVYVINDSSAIKYDSNGVEQWHAIPAGVDVNALVLDGAGNVYITGRGSGIYVTVKYSPDGVEQEVYAYLSPEVPAASSGSALASITDAAGNTYITGEGGTVKYNTNGVELWAMEYDQSTPEWWSIERPSSIAVSASGNVYVTGGSGWLYEYGRRLWLISESIKTVKYSPDGVEQWVAIYNGPAENLDWASSITVDASENVYVTGTSGFSGTPYDYVTIKYDTEGFEQWIAIYDGPSHGSDEVKDLVLDVFGNVYVTGWSDGDFATVKYDSEGFEQWVARSDGLEPCDNWAPWDVCDKTSAVTVDASGNVYVAGATYSDDTELDFTTIKYNVDGVEQWVARYNGSGNAFDYPAAITVDASDNIYITGMSELDTIQDYATVKYNPEGVEQWVAIYNGPGDLSDQSEAITVDHSGSVYVTGSSDGSGYATVKYNSEGVEQWTAIYGGEEGFYYDCDPISIALDGIENVYISGTCGSGSYYGGWTNYTTIKYIQVPVSVADEHEVIPLDYSLSQNYPNPFNPMTTIGYSLEKREEVELVVYNLLGKEIVRLVARQQPAGYHQVIWVPANVPSGIYLFRLTAGDFVQTKKMILLK